MFLLTVNFLSDLAQNNNKAWFEANRARYEREVRAPAVAFVEAIAPRLAGIAPQLGAVATGTGSSISRMHRDTRFSADKSPFKDWIGFHFRGESGKEGPGLYLRIAPDRCGIGVGIWMLEPADLRKVRQRMAAGQDWAPVRAALDAGGFSFIGDSLKRTPKEFPADHPFAEDLRRQTLAAGRPVDPALPAPEFCAAVEQGWRAGLPLLQFLERSLA